MIKIEIPKGENFEIKYLVFDYNGTVANNGRIYQKALKRLNEYTEVEIFIITADTYGTVAEELKNSNIKVKIISKENGAVDKENFIEKLGSKNVMAFGNGSNDKLMLKEAGIGICVIGKEGASVKAIMVSDLVVNNIDDALDYIDEPKKIIAGLRE
ncbi:MAG: HAD hydrolase family protein [Clostridiales bacterium]|nr:HAD hydrolase family protein [Clostridiales bacterium]